MSGLTLTVDAAAWRQHQQTVADATPGLVPVAKGNGYGFGLPRLAEEAELLGADTIAVGVPDEVSAVRERFSGDIVVLNPWRDGDPGSARTVEDERVIPTVSRADDLAALGAGGTPTRVLVEVMTSMRRHGIASGDLRMVADLADHLDFDG
ncbi:MAG TPA: alanine racemase, partial [Candidatus Avipropionibacterium avicola]|nr:alanine racemase [Candidatus Avipropionibacterium avicola]